MTIKNRIAVIGAMYAIGISYTEAENAIKSFERAVLTLKDVKAQHGTRRNKSDRKRSRANRWG